MGLFSRKKKEEAAPAPAAPAAPAVDAAAVCVAPVSGTAIPMTEVPDPVFSGLIVGPGIGIDPLKEPIDAVAPISGMIVKMLPHAYVIAGEKQNVLVHLGLDTVQLKGEGFTLMAEAGKPIEAGTPVIAWNPADIEAGGRSSVVPVVALELDLDTKHLADLVESGPVVAGQPVWTVADGAA